MIIGLVPTQLVLERGQVRFFAMTTISIPAIAEKSSRCSAVTA